MKLLPILVLNVVVAGGAILVYDQLRTNDPAPVATSPARTPEVSIESRLTALERGQPTLLKTDGIDPRVAARLAALEQRMQERPAAAPASEDGSEADAEAPLPRPGLSTPDGTSPEEVARFRKLQRAARAADRALKMRKRIDKTLAKLDLDLTQAQRTKLAATFTDFQTRRNEVWGEVKTNGAAQGSNADWGTIIADTNALLRRELSERVDDYLPRDDAERVSAALLSSGK